MGRRIGELECKGTEWLRGRRGEILGFVRFAFIFGKSGEE